MPYTRIGPFTNGTATPPIDKTFLDGVETFLLTLGGVTNTVHPITGWYHTDSYGAKGDAFTDDRAAIQAALTAAGTAYTTTGTPQRVYLPPRVHMVGAVNFLNDDGSTYGIVSLMLPSGVDFFGPGTIKAMNGIYGSGALYGVIRSKSGGISFAKIREMTIDGNKANNPSSTQCSNILLTAISNVTVNGVRSANANGNGILISGVYGSQALDLSIKNCAVTAATAIGIQASQFDGLEIDNNTVDNCGDNGIDIYGENGTTTSAGTNFRITNNRVSTSAVGIFPETCAYGIVANNHLNNNTYAAIHVNRINGAPTSVTLAGNNCSRSPIGIYLTGDMGSVYVRGNTITAVSSAGIQMGGGGAASSHVYIDGNFIDMATVNTGALITVASGTTTWSQSTIRRTLTQNTDRSRDVYNNATTTASSVSYDAANS